MSDIMLHGVLNEPIELWNDTRFDKKQRHCRYVEASQRIITQEDEIIKLKEKIVGMRTECNKRYSEQLQKIRKLEAEKMLQIQDELFEDKDNGSSI